MKTLLTELIIFIFFVIPVVVMIGIYHEFKRKPIVNSSDETEN